VFEDDALRYAVRIDEFGPEGARPVITGRRDIPTSKVMTRFGQYVDCEHNVERDFVRVIDFDPRFRRIQHQPHRLFYVSSGERVQYVPDFKLELTSGNYIVEVKTRREYQRKERVRERLSQIHRVYESLGMSFIIAFDDVIRIEPRFSNIVELRRYRSLEVLDDDRKAVIEHLKGCGSDTLTNCASLVKAEHGPSVIRSLAANHQVELDFSSRISMNTLCKIPSTSENETRE